MDYKFVFCILTYRNINDIQECLESIQEKITDNYKVIIVNGYYDDITTLELRKIAKRFNAEFIEVENKGYGYGNNCGIDNALKNYNFKYLIVSNPDIIIKKFNSYFLDVYPQYIVAPEIRTRKGKAQNPYWYRENKFAEKLIYVGYKKKRKFLLYTGFAITKAERILALLRFKISKKSAMEVYAAHGSFLILPYNVVNVIKPLYDEKMFLFAEENYISHVLAFKGYKTIYTPEISVLHKENGSIRIAKIDENDIARKSVIYYYEKLFQKEKEIKDGKKSGLR